MNSDAYSCAAILCVTASTGGSTADSEHHRVDHRTVTDYTCPDARVTLRDMGGGYMADLTMADFGPVVRRYVGTGQLVTGARSIACDVEAGQYNNGVVLAICTLYDGDPLLGFAIANDQATLEGCLIADGAPLVFNTPMFREMEGRTVAFIGRELVVGSTRDQQVTEVRFQLTNLKTHFRREWDLDGVKVKLEPLPDSRAKL